MKRNNLTAKELKALVKGSAVEIINRHLLLIEQATWGHKDQPLIMPKGRSKETQYMYNQLCSWGVINNYQVEEEFRFHVERKWRFDFAIPALKIAFEYEGIFSKKSRHTTVSGYSGDIEKYNAATADGWKVLRFTAKNYKSILQHLKKTIDDTTK